MRPRFFWLGAHHVATVFLSVRLPQPSAGCNSDTFFDYDIGYAYEYACGVNFFAGQVCPITNTSVSTIFVDDDPTFHQRDVTVGQYYSYDWSGGGIYSGDCEVWTVNNDQNSDAVSFCIQVDQV